MSDEVLEGEAVPEAKDPAEWLVLAGCPFTKERAALFLTLLRHPALPCLESVLEQIRHDATQETLDVNRSLEEIRYNQGWHACATSVLRVLVKELPEGYLQAVEADRPTAPKGEGSPDATGAGNHDDGERGPG